MAEPTQITFKFKEIAEVLVKKQGITEGYWGILVKFALGAANTIGPQGLAPTAFVPISEIGIQKFDEPNDLTIDAGTLNRPPTSTKTKKDYAGKRKRGHKGTAK